MMNLKKELFFPFFFVLVGALNIVSCKTIKYQNYFETLRRDTTINGFVSPQFDSKISFGDHLSITVTSKSAEEDALFNQAAGVSLSNTGSAIPNAFVVDGEGNIHLHRLGDFKVEGLTLKEFNAKLALQLTPYMKDIVVNSKFLNRKVTVLGEVAKPSVITIQEGTISLTEAIAYSGDMKQSALKSDILIIRDSANSKQIKHINLQDHSILSSRFYHLQANDIVYVKSNETIRMQEEKRRNFQSTFSMVSGAVALLVVILDRIIK